MDRDLGGIAAESLPTDVSLLDATGRVTWANARWLGAARAPSSGLVSGLTVGVDVLRALTSTRTAIAQAIADGLAAVIAGERGSFEGSLPDADGSPRWTLQASPLHGSARGAVLIRSEISGSVARSSWELPDLDDLPSRVGRLTPREREVLRLMVGGLNNREIAAQLGIGYTTVRSHAQAVIEKLGARSRLQAIAHVSRADVGAIMNTTPLGIGVQDVAVPAHVGLFYDAEADRRRLLLQFLRPAIDDLTQGIVLFGPPGIGMELLAQLEADLGRSLDGDVRSGRIVVGQTDRDPDQYLDNIRHALATLKARGHRAIRFFGDVKWGYPGFPLPEDALWVESRVNDILADTGAIVVCAYDTSRLPDKALIMGGLRVHPVVVIGDWLAENPSYLPSTDYLRAFLLQMAPPHPAPDRSEATASDDR